MLHYPKPQSITDSTANIDHNPCSEIAFAWSADLVACIAARTKGLLRKYAHSTTANVSPQILIAELLTRLHREPDAISRPSEAGG
jgi:hypothetical protein